MRKTSRGFHPSRNHFHRDRHLPRHSRSHGSHGFGGHSHSCSSSSFSSSLGSAIGMGIATMAVGALIKKAKETSSTSGNASSSGLLTSVPLQKGPEPKTIGGATRVYLPMIMRDFPDFHSPNAESDIKAVMRDYIYSIHNDEITMNNHAVNENVLTRIIPKQRGNVTDIIFHQLEIQNYQKSVNYATIIYKTSFGYRLNGTPIETRYEIHYTLQLRDNKTQEALRCKNCNAPIEILNAVSTCRYCDAKIIRDTIMSWVVSDIRELR